MTWDRDQGANLDRLKGADFEEAVAASAGGEAGLDTREKIVNFTNDEWFPSRLSFGKVKGRMYQEAREDAELRSSLEWRGSAASPQAA